jgi:hypothetical protein
VDTSHRYQGGPPDDPPLSLLESHEESTHPSQTHYALSMGSHVYFLSTSPFRAFISTPIISHSTSFRRTSSCPHEVVYIPSYGTALAIVSSTWVALITQAKRDGPGWGQPLSGPCLHYRFSLHYSLSRLPRGRTSQLYVQYTSTTAPPASTSHGASWLPPHALRPRLAAVGLLRGGEGVPKGSGQEGCWG